MSVATEFAPVLHIPERARTATPERLASITVLHSPGARSAAPPVRLTRRGVGVLAAAVVVLAAALVGLAWLSAPEPATAPARNATVDSVAVHAGDSLWSIASRLAPDRDPRAEVADLQRVNRIDGTSLVPGQVLRTH